MIFFYLIYIIQLTISFRYKDIEYIVSLFKFYIFLAPQKVLRSQEFHQRKQASMLPSQTDISSQ